MLWKNARPLHRSIRKQRHNLTGEYVAKVIRPHVEAAYRRGEVGFLGHPKLPRKGFGQDEIGP